MLYMARDTTRVGRPAQRTSAPQESYYNDGHNINQNREGIDYWGLKSGIRSLDCLRVDCLAHTGRQLVL